MQNRVKQYFIQEENTVQNYVEKVQPQMISELLARKGKLAGDFRHVMDHLFDTVARMQQEAAKQPIAYIYFSYLLSSIKDGACELQIALYDKARYLDLEEIYGYWATPFIDDLLRKDYMYFEKIAKQKVIRVQQYEIQSFILECVAPVYFDFLREFCTAELPILRELEGYRRMDKEENLMWLYGEFLGSAKPLAQGGAPRK